MQMEIAVGMLRGIVDQHQVCSIAAILKRCRMRGQVPEVVVAVDVAIDDRERFTAQ